MGASTSSGGMDSPDMDGQDDSAPAPDSSPDQDEGGTFFLPPDFVEGHDCKPGDTISLEVVGKDKDGDVEVRMSHDNSYGRKGGEMSIADDLMASKDKIMPGMNGASGGM